MTERRKEKRFLTCFAASVDHTGERTRSALIQNISVSGASLLTRAHVQLGESVRLDVVFAQDEHARTITGRVVRMEPVKSPLWSRSVSVEFDTPATEYEPEIRSLAALQASKGLVGPTGD